MTTTHPPQTLYQIQQAIREAKRTHPGIKVIVQLAVDTHLDLFGNLTPQKMLGCEVDCVPDWAWGAVVKTVDEDDDGNTG